MTLLSIKEASQRTGLTGHTIRHYTDLNLIPNLIRDDNNNRLFDDLAINWLFAIKFLRQAGLSLREVQAFFEETDLNPLESKDRALLLTHAITVADQKMAESLAAHEKLKAQLQETIDHMDC